MTSALSHGEGFELARAEGTTAMWLRLWWDHAGGAFDGSVTDIVHRVVRDGSDGLVVDLREAPPLANFPVRRRILAVLRKAAEVGIPTLVLVGASSLQRRDMQRLCPNDADAVVTGDPAVLDDWLQQHALAS